MTPNSLPTLASSTSDPKLSDDVSDKVLTLINKVVKTVLTSHQNDEFREASDLENAPQLEIIPENNRWAVVRDLHNNAVETSRLTDSNRNFIGIICSYWINNNRLTKQDYKRGITKYLEPLDDLAIDVPKVYEWSAQMICKKKCN